MNVAKENSFPNIGKKSSVECKGCEAKTSKFAPCPYKIVTGIHCYLSHHYQRGGAFQVENY